MVINVGEILAEPSPRRRSALGGAHHQQQRLLLLRQPRPKNRGNAEDLRDYWLHGKGAAKIRWGTPGDWTRCVRQLSKYMGPRAKGYCALRHHEATGMWTGDKEHRQMDKVTASGKRLYSNDFIIPKSAVLATAEFRAQQVESAPTGEKGAPFFIPLVIPENVESGDGRKFDKGVITMRELPLPLLVYSL